LENMIQPGRWIPAHIHHTTEEAWYVLDGELTFRIGDYTLPAPAGSFVLVPRGTVHSFGNTSPAPAKFLEIFSPAGMERYFEERAALASVASPIDQIDYAGLAPEAHAVLANKYNMEFV
jgi:mannose-6-phosphate isomerase-like protein (cupin superfamily)